MPNHKCGTPTGFNDRKFNPIHYGDVLTDGHDYFKVNSFGSLITDEGAVPLSKVNLLNWEIADVVEPETVESMTPPKAEEFENPDFDACVKKAVENVEVQPETTIDDLRELSPLEEKLLCDYGDDELVEELRARGFAGIIQKVELIVTREIKI